MYNYTLFSDCICELPAKYCNNYTTKFLIVPALLVSFYWPLSLPTKFLTLKLEAFAKRQKASISFVMSVRPHGTTRLPLDFHEIWYLGIFLNPGEKTWVSLKYDKNTGTLHEDKCIFMISHSVLLRMQNIWDKGCRQIQNKHLKFSNFFQNDVYEITWKNVAERGRAQMVI